MTAAPPEPPAAAWLPGRAARPDPEFFPWSAGECKYSTGGSTRGWGAGDCVTRALAEISYAIGGPFARRTLHTTYRECRNRIISAMKRAAAKHPDCESLSNTDPDTGVTADVYDAAYAEAGLRAHAVSAEMHPAQIAALHPVCVLEETRPPVVIELSDGETFTEKGGSHVYAVVGGGIRDKVEAFMFGYGWDLARPHDGRVWLPDWGALARRGVSSPMRLPMACTRGEDIGAAPRFAVCAEQGTLL